MKKYAIMLITLVLMANLYPVTSYAESIVVTIDGKEVNINAIVENDQLFLAIDQLGPALGLDVDTTNIGRPVISSDTTSSPLYTEATVTFSTKLITNNSVGDEWNYYIKVNDNTYNSNQQNSTIPLTGKDISIELIVYEYDASKSDYGYASIVVPYADLINSEKLTFSETIIVTENGGRYSGNTATVEFDVTVTTK